jgi:serine/threonine-protein kinase
MIGSTFGNYRVEEQIGRGGMGIVYRAVDSKLGRRVAIKVLPEGCAKDHELRARLEREARLLAALNNGHIASIHGIEEFAGACGLVLEYVPGDTLEKRISSNPLPMKEALKICIQIADALESAHAKGIIHRDLKPANVKITPEGTVKVLDFGLAKALQQEPAATDPEATTALETRANVVMGTAGYMSPEQAQSKPLDRRTDVWAFGCILYELLTGRRAFAGATSAEAMAAVLMREPEWKALPKDVPGRVRLLLRRCFEKDPDKRLRDMGDARLEMEDALSGAAEGEAAPAARGPVWPALAAGLLIGAALVSAWTWDRLRQAGPPQVVRFGFDVPQGQRILPTWNSAIALSPDGKTVAYSLGSNGFPTTFVRRLEDLEARPLSGARGAIPSFSPDGRYLMLMNGMQAQLKKVPVSGGAPVTFASFDMAFRGQWAPDSYYYWTDGYFAPIVRTPDSGGKPEPVTQLDLKKQERAHRHAQMLPSGRAIVFTVAAGGMETFDDARIDAYTAVSKRRKTLVQGGFSARYSPSGHLVYARGGALYAVAFNASSLEVTGAPVKVLDGVFMSANSGAAHFDISATGSLAYLAGKVEGGERTLEWVDRQGNASPLPLPPRSYLFPRVSPDGKSVAFEVEGVNHDLYVYDPARDVTTKMTTDGVSHSPVWTPDGKHLAFRSWKAGTMTMWWMPSDRSGPEERLTTVGARQSAVAFSPDVRYMTFTQMDPERELMDIWVLSVAGDRKPQPFARSNFQEGSGRFSPDGKWVAYCSNESGRPEVFVQPWPGPGPKVQVSSEGGMDPVWSHDGTEIFYRNGDKMMAVSVSLPGGFRPGKPVLLWEGHYSLGMSSSCGPAGVSSGNYDVTSDGRRFLMVKDLDQDAGSTRIVVVVNFAEELKRVVKTN